MKQIQTGKNFTRSWLAFGWSGFAMAFIWHVATSPIPVQNVRIVDTCLGFILGTVVSGLLMYYFGSSQSSSDKTDMLKEPTPDKTVTITQSESNNEA